jgi:hypothetical protein
MNTVARALVRAASRLVSTLAFELSSHPNKRRESLDAARTSAYATIH